MLDGPKFERYDSDESQNSSNDRLRDQKNKKYLLEWITQADFCKEFNLVSLCDHPF